MRRTTFRSRATVPLLVACLAAAVLVPTAIVPGAGAQEQPEPDAAAAPSAPAADDAGPGAPGATPGKEGRVLSAALEALADDTADATRSGEPAPADEPQVQAQLAELSLPSRGAGSIMVRDGGRIVVNVVVADTDDATLAGIAAAGAVITTVSAEYRMLSAEVPLASLEALGAVPGVVAVTEVLTPMTGSNAVPAQEQPAEGPPAVGTNVVNCTTNPTGIRSEGDTQLSVATARANSAVDGTGVKIGVLSDTYSRTTFPTSAANDVANAELPGPGNPCGNTTPVQVLNPGPLSGGIDEGRAMAQIVHDLAPKAPLAFSSAFTSDLDFADQIRALQAAGSKVIVDDVSYYNEPFYQDGPIAKAVNDVTAAGATYFSSAGNSTPANPFPPLLDPNGGSYEAPSFRGIGCPTFVLQRNANYTACHDYQTGTGTDNGNRMTIPAGETLVATLGWNEPMYGNGTDLDLYIIDGDNGQIIGLSDQDSEASGQRTEVAGWVNNTGADRNVSVVVARWAAGGAGTPRFKVIVHRNPATSVQFASSVGGDVAGPTVFGHNAMLAAGSIAAVPYFGENFIEPFSSRGPATYCWQPVNGTTPSPSMPCQTKNLDVAATDGVANSFFGELVDGTYRFFGTSASAPHAAAIAALQVQKQPCRTPAQYLAAQRASGVAFPMYGVKDYGSGRVTATTAITGLTVCAPPVAAGYHPLTPSRILDSRNTTGGWNAPLVAGAPRTLQVTGRSPSNIPATASAVVMNVTATNSTVGSFLKIWPAGTVQPNVSNLNFGPNQTIPNLVTVKLGAGGQVEIATAVGSVNVIADVVGYFDDGTGPGDEFTGIDPVRLLDSRGTNGGWNSPLAAGPGRDLQVTQPGRPNGVPASATAVIANVTVVGSTNESFLRVWPSGESEPPVSNLNFGAGQIIPNLVMVKIGAGGNIKLSNAVGSTHVVVDVVGYFDPDVGSRFFAVDPTRVLDSRVPTGLAGPWGPQQTRDLPIAGAAGTRVPSGATGVIANVTVTDGTAESLITVFPDNTALPTASNLNFTAGQIIPNLVAVRLPANGRASIYNDQGNVNVIADVVGYFGPTPP